MSRLFGNGFTIQPSYQVAHGRHMPLPDLPGERAALAELPADCAQREMPFRADIRNYLRQISRMPVAHNPWNATHR